MQHHAHGHLALVVEGDQADVRVGEGAGALLNLTQHLAGVGASEQGQLPPAISQKMSLLYL